MHPSKFDPKKHHRKSIRLQGYDYSQGGAYFVTIITYQRDCLFGEIVNEEMKLNRYGEIVRKWWDEIPTHFSNVEIGAFIIMPNHVHGIMVITDNRRGTVTVPYNQQSEKTPQSGGKTPPLRSSTLGQIVAYFKYQSTKEMNMFAGNAITKFWQRNYYEHIIRGEKDLKNKTDYIDANPMLWNNDEENPRYHP